MEWNGPALSAVAERTYPVKSLQEVTSQEESFMPDISGYIRERVKWIPDTPLAISSQNDQGVF